MRVIVPYAPGGPTDVCARLIAQKLSERLGQQFYVENVPGAGGNIGTGQAARAPADGYVILITVNSHVINPALYDKVPYDPFKDFAAVTLAAGFASALCVNPSVPANTVRDLVALIKANPGKYSFASPGFGTPSHLLGEQFRRDRPPTWCMFPTAAAARRSRRWSRATRRLPSRRCRQPCRK